MHRPFAVAAFVVVTFFALSPAIACRECAEQKEQGLYQGDFKLLGNGIVRSWARIDSEGRPVAVGITFTETALQGLATENPDNPHDEEYELNLPPEAAATGIDHIGLNWNPQGHVPPGIYDLPHFDVHFYLIDREQRDKITVEEDLAPFTREPEQRFVPQGYIFAPESHEPRMGAHWIDPTSPEFQGQPFTATFIYGFYDGSMAFYEPMMTREMLAGQPNYTRPIPQPTAVERTGYYPTQWSITHDAKRREVSVILHGLVHREASAD